MKKHRQAICLNCTLDPHQSFICYVPSSSLYLVNFITQFLFTLSICSLLAILSLQTIEHEHPIHKISFISHDPEDRHVFGYIYSPPRSAANDARKYYLFAIKSDKSVSIRFTKLFWTVTCVQEKDCGIYCYKEYGDQSVYPQSFVDNKHKSVRYAGNIKIQRL